MWVNVGENMENNGKTWRRGRIDEKRDEILPKFGHYRVFVMYVLCKY